MFHLKSRPGLNIVDLRNLNKAFLMLDKENTGIITYDINKIAESKFMIINIVEKYPEVKPDDQGKVELNFRQFMDVMTNTILNNRKKFGNEKISFESGKIYMISIETSNVSCFFCPFRKNDEFSEF